jgi:hypothetical protein
MSDFHFGFGFWILDWKTGVTSANAGIIGVAKSEISNPKSQMRRPCHFLPERASYFYQSFSRVRFYDALRLKRFWISERAGNALENLEVALSFLSIRNPGFA